MEADSSVQIGQPISGKCDRKLKDPNHDLTTTFLAALVRLLHKFEMVSSLLSGEGNQTNLI